VGGDKEKEIVRLLVKANMFRAKRFLLRGGNGAAGRVCALKFVVYAKLEFNLWTARPGREINKTKKPTLFRAFSTNSLHVDT